MKKTTLIFVLMAHVVFSISHAEVIGQALTKNPFIKPIDNEVIEDDRSVVVKNKSSETLTDRNLRATLTSSNKSLANIDGMMIFVGDQVKGYTLISVDEGTATLIKNGKEITLTVSELHKNLK